MAGDDADFNDGRRRQERDEPNAAARVEASRQVRVAWAPDGTDFNDVAQIKGKEGDLAAHLAALARMAPGALFRNEAEAMEAAAAFERVPGWVRIVAAVDAASRPLPPRGCGRRDFILSPGLAEKYREYANAIGAAAPSDKLDAFATATRYIAGLIDPTDFPEVEAVDRLWATAESAGLVVAHGEDAIQARLAAALAAPIVVDEDHPQLSAGAPEQAPQPARGGAKRRRAKAAKVSDDGGKAPPPRDGTEHAAGGDDDGPRSHGYSVDALNKEYAVVKVGSQAVIFQQNPEARQPEHQLRMLGIDAFKTWLQNRVTEVRGHGGRVKRMTWANRWMQDAARRQYEGLEFYPDPHNAPGSPQYLNLWSGFAVTPASAPDRHKYKTFRDHLLQNVCDGDAQLFKWVFGFFAHIVQRPRERLGIALVLRGKMGTGKTKVGEVIGSLFPRHWFLVDSPRYVTGQFNAHMASCLLLQADEAVWAGDKAAEGRLKGLITSSTQFIEAKGVDPVPLTNYVRLIMTSNEDWVVPTGKDERRFAVLDVNPRCAKNADYFAEMDAEMAAGGLAHLLGDLLVFDLASVDLRTAPRTDALLEQKIRSLKSVDAWWLERLMSGTTTRHGAIWEREIASVTLFDDYIAVSDKIGIKRKQELISFGLALRKLMPGMHRVRRKALVADAHGTKLQQTWCYLLPPLSEAREDFERALEQPIEWPIENAENSEAGNDEFVA